MFATSAIYLGGNVINDSGLYYRVWVGSALSSNEKSSRILGQYFLDLNSEYPLIFRSVGGLGPYAPLAPRLRPWFPVRASIMAG
jgi:hypothetical protein